MSCYGRQSCRQGLSRAIFLAMFFKIRFFCLQATFFLKLHSGMLSHATPRFSLIFTDQDKNRKTAR
jgi:hypothetical protein